MTIEQVLGLVRKNILSLAPYSTARDEYKGNLGVFLDANENPYANGYNRYPDPTQAALKKKISEIKKIPVENIFIGNGSDEAIDLCFRIFCEPRMDNAVTITPTYGMYRVAADINNVPIREVPLAADFSLSASDILDACDKNTKLIFLCSPNNPTGRSFPLEQIRYILNSFGGIVVVDEAYIDFSSQASALAMLAENKNLIVLQTLSKAYGMAALRLGLAFAHADIMSLFAAVKYPYNINLPAMEKAFELIARDVDSEIATIMSERQRLAERLSGMNSVQTVYPSDANFLLVKVLDAERMYNMLISGGVIVRDRSHIKGCEGCLRITVGTFEENNRLLEIIEKYEL